MKVQNYPGREALAALNKMALVSSDFSKQTP